MTRMLARKQWGELYGYGCHRNDSTALEIAVLDTPLRSSSASQRGPSRHTKKLTSEYLKSSGGAFTTMWEALMNDTLRGRPGRTRRGTSTKYQWRNVLKIAGWVGQNLRVKLHFLNGSLISTVPQGYPW
jgi:hypothetical protein